MGGPVKTDTRPPPNAKYWRPFILQRSRFVFASINQPSLTKRGSRGVASSTIFTHLLVFAFFFVLFAFRGEFPSSFFYLLTANLELNLPFSSAFYVAI